MVKCEKYLHQYGGHKFAAGLKIEKSKLNKLITSDSIEIKKESNKVEHLSCSKMFAEAMYNVHHNKSIDKLFINK